jgi:hypothetical protein
MQTDGQDKVTVKSLFSPDLCFLKDTVFLKHNFKKLTLKMCVPFEADVGKTCFFTNHAYKLYKVVQI